MGMSIPSGSQNIALTSLTSTANDSNQPITRDNEAIKQIASEYHVDPQPIVAGVNDLRSALKASPPDSEKIGSAVSEITAALDGPKINNEGAPAPAQPAGQTSGTNQGHNNDQSGSGNAANDHNDGGQWTAPAGNAGAAQPQQLSKPVDDTEQKLNVLRENLIKLGIPPGQIDQIIAQMRAKLEAEFQQRQAAFTAQQEAMQRAAAQQMAVGQKSPVQQAFTSAAGIKAYNVSKLQSTGNGKDLMVPSPFIYEGQYSDPNIRSYFTKNNVDVSTGTVNFKDGKGGSFVTQTPVGPGITSFNFSAQVSDKISGGGVFAYKANQAEYDIGEMNLTGDPMTITVGVHNHAIGQKVFSQDVNMRDLGYTDQSQLRNIRMEAKIEKGIYEVSYQNAAGQMQQVASYHDDGTIYHQMYETPADGVGSGPSEGVKWQANIWSSQENNNGSGFMAIENLQHQDG